MVVVLVLGGYGGIGSAVSAALEEKGLNVIRQTRSMSHSGENGTIVGNPSTSVFWQDLETFLSKYTLTHALSQTPVTPKPQLRDFSGLHAIICAQGSLRYSPCSSTTPKALHESMDAHVTPVLMAHQFLLAHAPASVLLAIGSDPYSEEGTIDLCEYVTCKHALLGMTRAMVEDLFGTHHRVVHEQLGNVATPLWDQPGAEDSGPPDDAEDASVVGERLAVLVEAELEAVLGRYQEFQ
ncbi:oxidoreductase short chain dehydrogenase/reductase domain protein [Carpediemonas membranifera]|uniref:Oxidoreductase short chain dehydrogenase/reductase domain protein n=1 Tax=Carpediemonas membranifera TaxID=201153 RepID=A0A8J6E4D3_9EUKA|nr:oxidoreductase short chain dehydrogenase/reductase domain protein [Carpediemonas membranifera]|eukprot:KAG9397058.1 oxidoreductase short chain dehydrogenase/reductase domain protein [Carpediemonas membranifera]